MRPIGTDRLNRLHEGLTDDSLRFALLAGLATVPFTLVSSGVAIGATSVSGSLSAGPLFLAGLVVGYYYSDRETESNRAGVWTGLAGSIAVILSTIITTVVAIGAGSRLTVIAVVAAPIIGIVGVMVCVLVASVGATIGDRVTTRLDRDRRVVDEAVDPPQAKWRRLVAGYALVAPAALFYVLWISPDRGAGVALVLVSMLALFCLSVGAFVGLFIEVTAPRVEPDWLPTVWLYVGSPLGVAAIVYVEAMVRGSTYPPGDAMYGFFGGLWVAVVVYLLQRRRHGSP